MRKQIERQRRRVKRSKGASHLTHGGDDYDHKSPKKARRAMSKLIALDYLQTRHRDD